MVVLSETIDANLGWYTIAGEQYVDCDINFLKLIVIIILCSYDKFILNTENFFSAICFYTQALVNSSVSEVKHIATSN